MFICQSIRKATCLWHSLLSVDGPRLLRHHISILYIYVASVYVNTMTSERVPFIRAVAVCDVSRSCGNY